MEPLLKFTLQEELIMLLRMGVALIAGGIVGFERRVERRPAGFRTITVVALGACVFTLVSQFGFEGLGTVRDPARVAAQIVTGVGFIGAGTILASREGRVTGLTTAASIWAAAGFGMAAGTGMYVLSLAGALITAVILWLFPRKREPDAHD